MKMRFAIVGSAALLAVLIACPAQAQRSFGGARGFGGARSFGGGARGFRGGVHAHGPFRGSGAGRFVRPRSGGRGRYYNRMGFITAPYFYPPDFYSDYYAEPPVTEAPPPQVVVVQTPTPFSQAPPAPPADPLVLELHGNHWVRITDSGESEASPENSQPGSSQASSRRATEAESALPVPALPPAVLVFRDGHQEQTKKYTIIGPIIYTSTSYWAGGSWTRKIPIAELDIPATLRLNQERGVKFNLPSAPNEVVVRP